MKANFFTAVTVCAVLGALVTAYWSLRESDASPGKATEQEISEALFRAVVSFSDVGAENVVMQDGSATFTISNTAATGSVTSSPIRQVAFMDDTADVYTIFNVNAGGSGTFVYLVEFSYDDARHALTQKNQIMLGDRIIVDSLDVVEGDSGATEIFVSIKERKLNDAMATVPTQPEVLQFTRTNGVLTLSNVIFGTIADPQLVLTHPLPYKTVPESFPVQGALRGTWYFEGSFPITIEQMDGTIVVEGYATALSDWMTENLVPFQTTVVVPSEAPRTLVLVIKNDNPSGDPVRDKRIEIPIVVQ